MQYFGDDSTALKIPEGHGDDISMSDIERCPIMASRGNKNQGKGGGCPMMNVDEDKKNPALEPTSFGIG